MKDEINPALWQELKRLGHEMTPDELRQRGVRRVITIKTSAVSHGIERAINRMILERTIGRAQSEELRDFSAAASAEFAAVIRDRDQYGGAHSELGEVIEQHRRELQAELEAVQQDLDQRRGFAEQQEDPERWPIEPERADELRLRVQARLLPIFERLPAGSPPMRSVVADLLEVFAEERAASLGQARREADADMARLERRIAKLVTSLEHTELVLDRVAQENKSTGRASGYREVQGLDPGAPEVEIRRGMMTQIFRANAELQERVDIADVGSPSTSAAVDSVVNEHAPTNGVA